MDDKKPPSLYEEVERQLAQNAQDMLTANRLGFDASTGYIYPLPKSEELAKAAQEETIIPFYDRPEISKRDYRRMRSLGLDLAAAVERAHEGLDEEESRTLLAKVRAYRNLCGFSTVMGDRHQEDADVARPDRA